MRITESQLRRIIRQEVRALRESPVDHAAATRGMTSRQRAQYWKGVNADLLTKQRAAAAAALGGRQPDMPEPLVPRGGKVPTVTGGRMPRDRDVAQAALEDWHSGMDAAEVVEFIVDQTLVYARGHEGDYDFLEGDRASQVVALIKKVDPEAGAELLDALSQYRG